MLGWKNRWAIFHCTKLNQPLEEIYISARFCIFNGKLSYQLWMYFNWQTQTLFLLFVWENAFWYLEESLHLMGFPGGSDSKKSGNSGDGVWSLGGEDPLEKEMATHPNILAWRIHGERSLVGYSPWGCKESDMTGWLTLTFTPYRTVFKNTLSISNKTDFILYQIRSDQSLSRVCLFVTPWTVAHQDPLSMAFSRQEYWSG